MSSFGRPQPRPRPRSPASSTTPLALAAIMAAIGTLTQPGGVIPPVHTGTAQGAAYGSLTLAASADATTDAYKWYCVRITGGAGAGQERTILASRKNLLKYSEDQRNTAEAGSSRPWAQFNNADIDVAQVAANTPSGVAGTVSRLQCSTTGALQRQTIYSISGLADTTAYCWSAYAKADQVPAVFHVFKSKAGNFPGVRFNLLTGAMTSIAHAGESAIAYGITPAQEPGWYRTWSAYDTKSGGNTPNINFELMTTSGGFYNATSIGHGLLMFGAQLNVGSAPDEYIQTVANAAVGVQIDRPWLVMPDATSTYEIYSPSASAIGALSQPVGAIGVVG